MPIAPAHQPTSATSIQPLSHALSTQGPFSLSNHVQILHPLPHCLLLSLTCHWPIVTDNNAHTPCHTMPRHARKTQPKLVSNRLFLL